MYKQEKAMSILDYKEDAVKGVNVTVTPRSGKNATYVITDAGFEHQGLKDMQPQAQVVWQALIAACEGAGTDEFTLDEANQLCEYLKDEKVLKTGQPAKRIFAYYRSLGAKDGGDGFLARHWLLVK
jgi:hypothetical protein